MTQKWYEYGFISVRKKTEFFDILENYRYFTGLFPTEVKP